MGDALTGRALDVACGTGLSTIALADRVEFAVGSDSVEAMVDLAAPASNVFYAVATAECLPFAAETFDLLTVCSGVHWFDQHAFFAKAARVLASRGRLGYL